MIGVIYKIASPTGKVYIGQTQDLCKRLACYRQLRCKSQVKLYASLCKYGFEAHVVTILEEVDISILHEREMFYIHEYNAVDDGLNCSYDTVAFMRGRKHSAYTRQAMSTIRKGRTCKPRSKEHSQKIGQSAKQRYQNPANHPRFGVSLSEHTRSLIRTKSLGRTLTDTHKAAISSGLIGRVYTEETRKKMSLNSGRRKVTLTMKNRIQELANKGIKQFCIATIYGLSISSVSRIKLQTKI